MSSILGMFIIVVILGSGLAILAFSGEHGRWTMFSFLTLFVLIGAIIMVWGIHHMVTGVVHQSPKGPVAGWQMALVGGGLIVWFGKWLVKEWREIHTVEKPGGEHEDTVE